MAMGEREEAPPLLGARPTGGRLALLAILSVLPLGQYFLFYPYFSDPGSGLYPLLILLSAIVAMVGEALAVQRFFRPRSLAGLRLQELALFVMGGIVGILSLTIIVAGGRGGWAFRPVSAVVGFLLLLLASTLQTRMMAREAGFLAPVLAGLGWPLLVPFQRLVEAIWHAAPWVFSSVTFSVMTVLMLLAVLAIYLKATVPVTLRYLAVWAAAIGMMAIVPFHEVIGIFSNRSYGEVDRSVAFGGLVLGLAAMVFFARRSLRAGTVRKELALGDELSREGLHREAVDHYERALSVQPEMTDALVRMELALRAAGADREAALTIQKVLKHTPRK